MLEETGFRRKVNFKGSFQVSLHRWCKIDHIFSYQITVKICDIFDMQPAGLHIEHSLRVCSPRLLTLCSLLQIAAQRRSKRELAAAATEGITMRVIAFRKKLETRHVRARTNSFCSSDLRTSRSELTPTSCVPQAISSFSHKAASTTIRDIVDTLRNPGSHAVLDFGGPAAKFT